MDNKKIYYIANIKLPHTRANGIQVMHMCDGFACAGKDVTLVVPKTKKTTEKEAFDFYGLKPSFKIVFLPIVQANFLRSEKLSFMLRLVSFSISLGLFLVSKEKKSVVYTRGEMVLPLVLYAKRMRIFWETHIKPGNMSLYMRAAKYCCGLIVVTQYYKDELVEKFGIKHNKVLCEPDAVSLERFVNNKGREQARDTFGIPKDKIVLMYVGSDLSWKGLDVFEQAVTHLPREYVAVLVGNIKKRYDDPRFLYMGRRAYDEIPLFLAAADFLVLPGKKGSIVSERYTSPMKLFEYMAANRPIVAFNIPSFRDILSEDTAFFVPADNPEKIAENIVSIDDSKAREKALRAFDKVQDHSWEKRAKRIVEFISKKH